MAPWSNRLKTVVAGSSPVGVMGMIDSRQIRTKGATQYRLDVREESARRRGQPSGSVIKRLENLVAADSVNTPDWLSDESIAAFMASVDSDVAVAA